MWQKEFKPLELRGGHISYICNDDEDMIEITYPDGMLIDVGKAMSTGLCNRCGLQRSCRLAASIV